MKIESVNIEEYDKQRRQAILKNDMFIQMNILIGEKEDNPITEFRIRHCSNLTIAKMITILEAQANMLKEEYPIANLISKSMNAQITKTYKKGEDY